MLKNNVDEKASISLKRIIGICLIFLFISGICVFAANKQVRNVQITLSNGCEMNVVTSKTKVADILDEKHIILLPEEKVTPDANSTIGANGKIIITEKTAQEEVAELVSAETENKETKEEKTELNIDMIAQAYNPITEQIVVETVAIPFETVTKNVSDGAKETKNQVLQEGKEGKREVTYRVKYQNEVEIDRKEINSVVIEEPVNKIIQVKAKQVTSRGSSLPRTTGGNSSGTIYKITAYCPCSKCCGKATGRTASGTKATPGRTVAASSKYAFGTKLNIGGHIYTVEDRGGAITGNKIDIFVNSHSEALQWGVRYLPVSVVN
jgi:hypothetical protein